MVGRSLPEEFSRALVTQANDSDYRALGVRLRSLEVAGEGRLLKLAVIEDDRGPEGGRGHRFHRFSQNWNSGFPRRGEGGLAGCEARTPPAVISHVVLVCVVSTFLPLLKPLAADRRQRAGQQRCAGPGDDGRDVGRPPASRPARGHRPMSRSLVRSSLASCQDKACRATLS